MAVPKIYKDFYEQKVFTLGDVKNRYKGRNTPGSLNLLIHNSKAHGYIGSVKKGLYYTIPHGFSVEDYKADKYLIASRLSPAAVIAYHSALEFHGVAQSVFNQVFVLTRARMANLDFQGTQFTGVIGHLNFGCMNLMREGVAIRVTDRERTLVDCIDRLRYAGGLEEYFKSAEGFPSINFQRIEEYLKRYKKINLYAKVGFLLTLFEKKWSFPADVRRRMRNKIRKKVYYLDHEKKENVLNKEWNLMIPENLREIIFSV